MLCLFRFKKKKGFLVAVLSTRGMTLYGLSVHSQAAQRRLEETIICDGLCEKVRLRHKKPHDDSHGCSWQRETTCHTLQLPSHYAVWYCRTWTTARRQHFKVLCECCTFAQSCVTACHCLQATTLLLYIFLFVPQ